jgi:hypothetical protein
MDDQREGEKEREGKDPSIKHTKRNIQININK